MATIAACRAHPTPSSPGDANPAYLLGHIPDGSSLISAIFPAPGSALPHVRVCHPAEKRDRATRNGNIQWVTGGVGWMLGRRLATWPQHPANVSPLVTLVECDYLNV